MAPIRTVAIVRIDPAGGRTLTLTFFAHLSLGRRMTCLATRAGSVGTGVVVAVGGGATAFTVCVNVADVEGAEPSSPLKAATILCDPAAS